MFSKIKEILKSCFLFWKSFVLNKDKKNFLQKNREAFKTQIIVLLSVLFATYVTYSSLRPAIRGACRVILQVDSDSSELGMGRITGVEAKRAVKGTTLREVKSIGTLKANAEVVIKSEIPGKISEIAFKEGSNVQKGDVLIKFEDVLYKAEKDKCEAEYLLRKGEYERVKSLYEKNVGSKKAYDEALAQMQASKAQLDSANAQFARTVIKAPFDGVIGIMKGSATPGNIVQQQTELVYMVDNSMVRVEFTVPAKYIDDVAEGQNVELTVDAYKDRVFSGVVDAIDSEVDIRNHSVLVRAVIPNKSGHLKHGMFANVKLVTGEKSGVILIDEDGLLREGSIEYVWIIDEKGRAYRQRVLSGAKDMHGVEIIAGLKAGDIVVTTGQLKLTEGTKTKILNKEEFEESSKDFEKQKSEEMNTTKQVVEEEKDSKDKADSTKDVEAKPAEESQGQEKKEEMKEETSDDNSEASDDEDNDEKASEQEDDHDEAKKETESNDGGKSSEAKTESEEGLKKTEGKAEEGKKKDSASEKVAGILKEKFSKKESEADK